VQGTGHVVVGVVVQHCSDIPAVVAAGGQRCSTEMPDLDAGVELLAAVVEDAEDTKVFEAPGGFETYHLGVSEAQVHPGR